MVWQLPLTLFRSCLKKLKGSCLFIVVYLVYKGKVYFVFCLFVFWFTLQEEQERRSGIKEPSHSDSDSSSGSKKYVKTTLAQLLGLKDFFK